MIINTHEQIQCLAQKLSDPHLKRVALDTEFFRRDSYWPKLCLLQIALPTEVFVIDMLAVDATPVIKILDHRKDCLKIFHSARQDLEAIFYHFDLILEPLFDTQIAASFLDFEDHISYKNLVLHFFNIDLDKTFQSINWCERPLLESQILYASEDARYLLPLFDILNNKLIERGRLSWAEDINRLLIDRSLYWGEIDEYFYQKIYRPNIDQRSFTLQKYMTNFREQFCRIENIARGFFLTNEEIQQMHADRELKKDFKNPKWAQKIEKMYEKALSMPVLPLPELPAITREEGHKIRKFKKLFKKIIKPYRIPLRYVADTKIIYQFLYEPMKSSPLLEGWRYDIVGKQLLEGLKG